MSDRSNYDKCFEWCVKPQNKNQYFVASESSSAKV